MLETLVIGAGISGLSAAHRLQQQGVSLLVAESRESVGGNIVSRRSGEFWWEEGPNSFSPSPPLLALAVEVGLKEKLVFADRRLPRFVYWQGRLRPVPMSPPAAIASSLLSPRAKLRLLAGALGFVPPVVGEGHSEETVGQFFRRHLGSEVAERLVAPFVSGVYAGDVEQLSASAAFSRVAQMADTGGGLLAGAILSRRRAPKAIADPELPATKPGQLGSFAEGLQMLPQAIAARLGDAVRCNWTLVELQVTGDRTYRAMFSTPEGSQQLEAKSVVLTTPAPATAEILRPLSADASAVLESIFYPPVACVVLAYPETALRSPLSGFGNLIPRGQGIRTLGTIWSSALFPGRTPSGWFVLTNFIGGATDRALGTLDEEAIAAEVRRDLENILVRPESEPKVLAVRLWPQAIPQYTLGHAGRLQQLDRALADFPGLFLCSNYTDGVALGDCVRRGWETAAQVAQHVSSID